MRQTKKKPGRCIRACQSDQKGKAGECRSFSLKRKWLILATCCQIWPPVGLNRVKGKRSRKCAGHQGWPPERRTSAQLLIIVRGAIDGFLFWSFVACVFGVCGFIGSHKLSRSSELVCCFTRISFKHTFSS